MLSFAAALGLELSTERPDVVAFVGGGGKSSAAFRLAKEVAAAGHRAVITHTARIAAFQTDWAPAWLETDGIALPVDELAAALASHNVCLLTGVIVGDRRQGLPPAMVDELARLAPTLGIKLISIEADGSKMRPVKAPAEHEPVLPAATTLLVPVMGLDAIGAPIAPRWVHRPEHVRAVLGLDADESARLTPTQAARLLVAPAGGAKARPERARLLPVLNKADTLLRLIYGRLVAQQLTTLGQPTLLMAVGTAAAMPVIERWGPVAVVVLAAGAASRMGRPKQVEVVNGEAMVVRAVQTALAAAVGPVLVITGAHAPLVTAALAPLQQRAGARLLQVHNKAWSSGQASSVRQAVAGFAPGVQAAIFMPVDQPLLDSVLLCQLVRAWRTGAQLAAPEVDGVQRGAPALFDRCLFGELLKLEGDVGGRAVLGQHSREVVGVPTPAAWLHDVDKPEDLKSVNLL